jgi:hypothetical protein
MNETELKSNLAELKSDMAKHAYVYARASGMTKEQSIKDAGVSKAWFYSLPKEEQERLEMLASELAALPRIKAMQKLEENAEKAAEVLAKELDSRDARLRVDVAKDVLDRNGITKQTQKVELTGKDGGAIPVELFNGAVKKVYGGD